MDGTAQSKRELRTLAEKNRVISRIIDALITRNSFLMLGHRNPDEDCVASMVSFALLAVKFSKSATVYLGVDLHERLDFLLQICRYNGIRVAASAGEIPSDIDTVVVCDTPKPSMLPSDSPVPELLSRSGIVRIEFDHHLGADSGYSGDPGYRLVTEASSSCELVGHVAFKLLGRKDLLERFGITDLFSRNLVLSLVTGIIGDSGFGRFLKSAKERRAYALIADKLGRLLATQTVKRSNLGSMEDVFRELQRLSAREEHCFGYLEGKRKLYRSFAYVVLEDASCGGCRECDTETLVAVTRSMGNRLAEESGRFGIVAYRDPQDGGLYQFRARRNASFRSYDLRSMLALFGIENGGGHEGAIGFRVPADRIDDLEGYVLTLIDGVERDLLERNPAR